MHFLADIMNSIIHFEFKLRVYFIKMVRWEGKIYNCDVELTLTWFHRNESNEINDILKTMTDLHLGSLVRQGFHGFSKFYHLI